MAVGPKTVALIVAAGVGTRAGGGVPKQYRAIGGKALLSHAIDHLQHPAIDEVRVVIGPSQEAQYRKAIGARALPAPIVGGLERQDSVRAGLEAFARDGGAELVLVHDAARPFVPAAVIDRLVDAARDGRGAVPVLPVVDTIVQAGDTVGDVVPRETLLRVQTPQAFPLEALLEAHRAWRGGLATDDAQIARAAGIKVVAIEGDERLAKITSARDLESKMDVALSLITRTGLGFDVHAFAVGEELWLGGVLIPHERGLKGHSDADVVLHTITDALLGTMAAGDIGDHFPPSDPQWKGARSALFLEHARDLVRSAGGCIDHVDVTIMCEAPKIGPHREAIRRSIAEILELGERSVSVKATTTERLGFTGRGEGIAAQAVATVRLPHDIGA
jgi:2-C-methyl-D-erythritol 4-phosphate cytidylyltransferase / 2-C-methyl-D-erythritol 2,4-cyclodiphosphate synthase